MPKFKKRYLETINKDLNSLKDVEKESLFKYMKILYYLL